MLKKSIRTFISVLKAESRFASFIRKTKYKHPFLSADQQLVKDVNDDCESHKITIPRSRKGITFYNHFEGKSIEGVDDKDERFSNAIINARNISNSDNNLMVLEGINMIRDAIKMNAVLVSLFFTKREMLQDIPCSGLSAKANVYYVRYRDMIKFSNMKTPPGIMAIFCRPVPESLLTDPFLSRKLPLTLILDNVREPGNLGTIIRTAAALNINKVLMTTGCVDLYNEKVVRGSMSSLFVVPVFAGLDWETIARSIHPACTVHCADVSPSTTSLHDDSSSSPYFSHHLTDFAAHQDQCYGLVVGGETSGLSKEARALSLSTGGSFVTIPTVQAINSLNSAVAAAIIMSAFQRAFLASR